MTSNNHSESRANLSLRAFQEDVRLFWEKNPCKDTHRSDFLLDQLNNAIATGDEARVDLLVEIAMVDASAENLTTLHEMLLVEGHRHHQEIIRVLQLLARPASIPALRKAFEQGQDHMVDYNGSGYGSVAKWFSHALADIGTPDAIDTLRAFSRYPDEEVANEMLYRLSKVEH